ncbi:MAG: hypothetical protein H0Z25_00890 [Kosmotoga sp.]|uniref:hypothetical protein n=1 Tax=Kosmotoga sp. TaxID=1955248 RepID=UPI001DD84F88|nr:hypothetical protein [Kosmotoga sp.]MBO8165758.1 hypothetical protein [Kosmotoga sp.]
MKKLSFFLVTILVLILLTGCPKPVNPKPVMSNFQVPEEVLSGQNFTVSVVVTDNDLAKVTFEFNGEKVEITDVAPDNTYETVFTAPATAGSYEVEVTAEDAVTENAVSLSKTVNVREATEPSVEFEFVLGQQMIDLVNNQEEVLLRVYLNDPDGLIEEMEARVSDSDGNLVYAEPFDLTKAEYIAGITAEELGDPDAGTYDVSVVATDSEGNGYQSDPATSPKLYVHREESELVDSKVTEGLNEEFGFFENLMPTIQATVTFDSLVTVKLIADGKDVVYEHDYETPEATTKMFEFQPDLSGLKDGWHTFVIELYNKTYKEDYSGDFGAGIVSEGPELLGDVAVGGDSVTGYTLEATLAGPITNVATPLLGLDVTVNGTPVVATATAIDDELVSIVTDPVTLEMLGAEKVIKDITISATNIGGFNSVIPVSYDFDTELDNAAILIDGEDVSGEVIYFNTLDKLHDLEIQVADASGFESVNISLTEEGDTYIIDDAGIIGTHTPTETSVTYAANIYTQKEDVETSFKVSVVATDKYANSETVEATVVIDTIKPTGTISFEPLVKTEDYGLLGPDATQTMLSWEFEDFVPGPVEIVVDGGSYDLWPVPDATYTGSATITLEDVDYTTVYATATVNDLAGNKDTFGTLLEVDTLAPRISTFDVKLEDYDEETDEATITITYAATDNAWGSMVLEFSSNVTINGSTDSYFDYDDAATTLTVVANSKELYVKYYAVDEYGNETKEVEHTIYDYEDPVIDTFGWTDGAATNATETTLYWQVTDTNFDHVELLFDNAGVVAEYDPKNAGDGSGGTIEATVTLPPLDGETVVATLVTYDTLGNEASQTREVLVDNVAPEVELVIGGYQSMDPELPKGVELPEEEDVDFMGTYVFASDSATTTVVATATDGYGLYSLGGAMVTTDWNELLDGVDVFKSYEVIPENLGSVLLDLDDATQTSVTATGTFLDDTENEFFALLGVWDDLGNGTVKAVYVIADTLAPEIEEGILSSTSDLAVLTFHEKVAGFGSAVLKTGGGAWLADIPASAISLDTTGKNMTINLVGIWDLVAGVDYEIVVKGVVDEYGNKANRSMVDTAQELAPKF